MQLSQNLSFADQSDLYRSSTQSSYTNPFDTLQDPRVQDSLQATWEKFRILAELFTFHDKHGTNGVSIDELLLLTTCVGLGSLAPSFSRLFAKLPKSPKGTYEFDRCFKGLQLINYPKMSMLPPINYKARNSLLACTLFRGKLTIGSGDRQVPSATMADVSTALSAHFQTLNIALLLLDPTHTGYVTKREMKLLLRVFNLHEGRATYLLSRGDKNGSGKIAFVEVVDGLAREDYPSFRLSRCMGPNPARKHQQTIAAMSSRSNYSGSLSGSTRDGGSSRGGVTDRSDTSLQSYMSNDSRASAASTGQWPGHRSMTYSSPGSNRSEKTQMVPRLPALTSPTQHGGFSVRSGMSNRSDRTEEGARNLPFMKRSPSKGKLKYVFNSAKMSTCRLGKVYRQIHEQFLQFDDEGYGFLPRQEIRGICVRLGMEAFESVFDGCSVSGDGERISYVDFANGLKQKFEPGQPNVYSGTRAPQKPAAATAREGEGTAREGTNGSHSNRNGRKAAHQRSPKKARDDTRNDGIRAFADELGKLDMGNTGKMTADEIRGVCRQFEISEEALDGVMKQCDVDAGGKYSYVEFVNLLKNELGGTYRRIEEEKQEEGHSYAEGEATGGATGGAMGGPPVAAHSPPRQAGGGGPDSILGSPEQASKLHTKFSHLTKAFENADRRMTGMLDERELRRLCGIYHLGTTMIERALERCDTGAGQGKIAYVEFTNNILRLEFQKQNNN